MKNNLNIKPKWNLLILTGIFALANIGCDGGFKTAAINKETAFEKVDKGESILIDPTIPQCQVDYSDYKINANLVAFQEKSKVNAWGGFDLLSKILSATIGAKLKIGTGIMSGSLELMDPVNDKFVVAMSKAEGTSTEIDFALEIDAFKWSLGVGYYSKTPLYTLTEKTFDNGLKNLRSALNKVESKWNSRVVWVNGNYEMIAPAGTTAGLKVGDTFEVYNTEYIWSDDPCTSDLLFVKYTSEKPLAIFKVQQVKENSSLLVVEQNLSDEEIKVGAHIIPSVLVDNKDGKRYLRKSVRVDNVKSGQLIDESGSVGIDLTLYVRDQLPYLFSKYGFYPRK